MDSIGSNLKFTIFGTSHGSAIGGVLEGLPSGIPIDIDYIYDKLMLRSSSANSDISTPRKEADKVEFLSGVYNDVTTGSAIAFLIRNENVHSSDYDLIKNYARPGHSDFPAYFKYDGKNDYRGGGKFSGRLTASIVVAGAICAKYLESEYGMFIGSHILTLNNVQDKPFDELNVFEKLNIKLSDIVASDSEQNIEGTKIDYVEAHKIYNEHIETLKTEITELNKKTFAIIDDTKKDDMINEINAARSNKDSVGGILETCVISNVGIGEPYFDSLEAKLSHMLFSIGGVKGVEFGEGFNFAYIFGSESNDQMFIDDTEVNNDKARPYYFTNHNGGITGGISNGAPIIFRTVIKPTPSIAKAQNTVNYELTENKIIEVKGRHDPAIIHRARVVVDMATALVLTDLIMGGK